MSRTDAMERLSLEFGERRSLVAGLVERFTWHAEHHADEQRILLSGSFTIDDAAAVWKRIGSTLAGSRGLRATAIDLSGVTLVDGVCMALLVHLRSKLRSFGQRCDFEGANPAVQRIVQLYGRKARGRRRPTRAPANAIEQVGGATVAFVAEIARILDFLGQIVVSAARALRNPKTMNLRDVGLTMERAGADAAPIVLLINFLIGFVMAYQSAAQLKQFGANIYVADLVGVSVTRELAPLMTAIIVCGRSGAAFAAELGTMKVAEEVDALRTLGFMPLRYLVMPRIVGLMLVAPILVLLADAVGILGGGVVAATSLDVTPTAFWVQLKSAVDPSDVISGLVKGIVFSAAIALIGCQQGLATSGGAEGVGKRTTGAVVATLFALILLDALFTIVLQGLGL
jgi:phospholipid/cholesterol/gamma-HCH transport system permease protein